jgi:hypothetical protein
MHDNDAGSRAIDLSGPDQMKLAWNAAWVGRIRARLTCVKPLRARRTPLDHSYAPRSGLPAPAAPPVIKGGLQVGVLDWRRHRCDQPERVARPCVGIHERAGRKLDYRVSAERAGDAPRAQRAIHLQDAPLDMNATSIAKRMKNV